VGLSETATPDEVSSFGSLGNRGETIRSRTVSEILSTRSPTGTRGMGFPGGRRWIEPGARRSEAGQLLAACLAGERREPEGSVDGDCPRREPRDHLVPLPMESELHIFLISEGECLLDGISLTSGSRRSSTSQRGF